MTQEELRNFLDNWYLKNDFYSFKDEYYKNKDEILRILSVINGHLDAINNKLIDDLKWAQGERDGAIKEKDNAKADVDVLYRTIGELKDSLQAKDIEKNDAEMKYKKRVKTLEVQVEELKKELEKNDNKIQHKIEELEEKYRNEEKERFDNIQAQIKDMENINNKKLNDQNVKISLLQKEINRLTAENQSIEDDKNEIQAELNTVRKNNEILSKEKFSNQKKIEDAESETIALRNEKEAIEKDLKDRDKTLKDISKQIDIITNKLSIYKPLLDALKDCDTFSDIVKKNDLADNDELNALFNLAAVVGKTDDFADVLYTTAVDIKKETNEYISADEVKVYSAINKCYRALCALDFDLFENPGGQSVDAAFERTKFNKNEVENMADPRKNSLTYATNVYVPLLRSMSTQGIYYKAKVEAGNI